ncbi:MAG TPA: hypothetical protein VFC41_09245 [Anaerovoracaceae bacterium]|nr:hypothetical protein [Anaerovoracaceae bacterium]
MIIYNSSNVQKFDIVVDDKTILHKRLMAEDKIICPVVVSEELIFSIGDYILLDGSKYYINRDPALNEISDTEFKYNITFEGEIYSLLNLIFKDSGKTRWEMYGSLDFFIDKILSHYTGWTKGAIKATDAKVISFQSITCREALNKLAVEFNAEYLINGKELTFVTKVENTTGLTFERGVNKGLYTLSKQNVDDGNTVTRIIPTGSKRNITASYGSDTLTIAPIEDTSNYPLIVEKEVEFPDIYPQFAGSVSVVSPDFLTITCPQIDFDLNIQWINGVTAKIVFLDGQLAGNDFEITKPYDSPNTKVTFRAKTVNGQILPSVNWRPQIGDAFTLVDINMPLTYITNAEARLTTAANEWLSYYSKLRIKYKLTFDPRYLRDKTALKLGDIVTVQGDELRILGFSYPLLYPTRLNAEISNYRDEYYEDKLSTELNNTLQLISKANITQRPEILRHLSYDPISKTITADTGIITGGLVTKLN